MLDSIDSRKTSTSNQNVTLDELFSLPMTFVQYLLSIERMEIHKAIKGVEYNKTEAARALGVTYRALRHRMQRLREWTLATADVTWHELRQWVLSKYGRQCMRCGSLDDICVDHIKPRSLYPWLALDRDNLQVLCEPCNRDKRKDIVDYRVAA